MENIKVRLNELGNKDIQILGDAAGFAYYMGDIGPEQGSYIVSIRFFIGKSLYKITSNSNYTGIRSNESIIDWVRKAYAREAKQYNVSVVTQPNRDNTDDKDDKI